MLHIHRHMQLQRSRPGVIGAAAAAAATALCRTRPHLAVTHAAAAAAFSTAAASTAPAAARAASKTATAPRRQTWLREQTQLAEQRRAEAEAAAAAASAAVAPVAPAAVDSSAADLAPTAAATAAAALLPSLSLSHLLMHAPNQSAVTFSSSRSLSSDPMSLLDRAGIVRRLGSACVLLPAGMRSLSKLERTLSDELAVAFQPQEIAALNADAAAAPADPASAASAAAPYATSFASQLPLFTELLAPEFRSESKSAYHTPLARATLAASVWHPAAAASAASSGKSKALGSARSSASSLWSASKHTRDLVSLSSGSRAAAMERYHALLDCYARTISQLGESQALVVETSPSSRGAQGIDADLAHELHVPAFNPVTAAATGANSALRASSHSALLKCDQCDYVAKIDRAVSKGDAAMPPNSALSDVTPSPQNLPLPLQRYFREWMVRQLALAFPASVVQRLQLSSESIQWKCEMLVDRSTLLHSPSAGSDDAAASLPIVYLVLLREADELNIAAVSEHVASQGLLRRIDDATLTYEVLRRTLSDDEAASLPAFAAASASRGPSPRFRSGLRFDPRPELLIDASLIPEGLDLDMEAIAAAQHEEAQTAAERAKAEEEERIREAERIEAEAAASAAEIASSDSADNDSPSAAAPVTAAHANFERTLSSAARSLAPGQSLDLLQMDLASQGIDPKQARAQLVEEARELQRQAHEDRLAELQARSNEEMMRAMEAAEAGEDLEEDEGAQADETAEPAASVEQASPADSASAPADASSAPVSSSLSSSLRHFEYSPQGFFRSAQAGERCAMHSCKTGRLALVHTHVIANAAFVGRQELVNDEPAAEGQRKKQYLHTIYGRFSSYDLLTHLLLKSLKLPSAAASTATPSSAGLTLDSLTLLHYPGLLAPIQLALVPVLSSASDAVAAGNPRDFHRNQNQARQRKAESKEVDAKVWSACHELHQAVAALALTPPTIEQASLGVASFPSQSSALDGDLVIDDRTSLALNARVQSLVSMGVPVLVLIQPRSLHGSGQVSLVLNRAGVALAPRRVPLQGLATLLHKMMRANHAALLQSKRAQQQEQQKQEEMRKKQKDEADKAKAEHVSTKPRRS